MGVAQREHHYLKLAAEQGHSEALVVIGSAHLNGYFGIEQDDAKAAKYLLQAYENSSSAAENLAKLHIKLKCFDLAFFYIWKAGKQDRTLFKKRDLWFPSVESMSQEILKRLPHKDNMYQYILASIEAQDETQQHLVTCAARLSPSEFAFFVDDLTTHPFLAQKMLDELIPHWEANKEFKNQLAWVKIILKCVHVHIQTILNHPLSELPCDSVYSFESKNEVCMPNLPDPVDMTNFHKVLHLLEKPAFKNRLIASGKRKTLELVINDLIDVSMLRPELHPSQWRVAEVICGLAIRCF